jgi:hypothetical protein
MIQAGSAITKNRHKDPLQGFAKIATIKEEPE